MLLLYIFAGHKMAGLFSAMGLCFEANPTDAINNNIAAYHRLYFFQR